MRSSSPQNDKQWIKQCYEPVKPADKMFLESEKQTCIQAQKLIQHFAKLVPLEEIRQQNFFTKPTNPKLG